MEKISTLMKTMLQKIACFLVWNNYLSTLMKTMLHTIAFFGMEKIFLHFNEDHAAYDDSLFGIE